MNADHARRPQRRADGRRRHADRPRRRRGLAPEVEIGQDTVVHPNVYLEGAHAHRRALRDSGRRAASSIPWSADDVIVQNYCVIRESTVGAGVHHRTVLASPPRQHARRRRAHRQLRRAEEGEARARGRRPVISPISATRRSARTSTSAPARSRATTTARRSTRPSSTTAPSSAATRSSSRRSRSAPAPTSPPARRSRRTCPTGALGDRAAAVRRTSRAGPRSAKPRARRAQELTAPLLLRLVAP